MLAHSNAITHLMPLCVCPLGNSDSSNQSNITCQPNLEESANPQQKSQEDMENMDSQGSVEESSTDAPVSDEAHKPS